MADENNTIEETPSAATLDLRPPVGDVRRELLRLGLKFDMHDTSDDSFTWRNYDRGIDAYYIGKNPKVVNFTDTTTGVLKSISLDELRQTTGVISWMDEPTATTPAAS